MAGNLKRFPTADEMKSLILGSKRPLIFRGFIEHWPFLKYSSDDWERLLRGKILTCRAGKRRDAWNEETPQFERKCRRLDLSYEELLQWQNNSTHNPELMKMSTSDWFLYFDYKYMAEVFDSGTLNCVDWSTFGFEGRTGSESTLWIGTEGANTPCHYDTYGCNLVAQISGQKRWVLFPPEDLKYLRPTRIPYEESSVYSSLDFQRFPIDVAPCIKESTPHVVVLEPGDVLFLPRHWWHYVESLENAISINTWIELPCDAEARVQEALVKFIVSNVVRNVSDNKADDLLNPNEDGTRNLPLSEISRYTEVSLQEAAKIPPDSNMAQVSLKELIGKYSECISPVQPTNLTRAAKIQRIHREETNDNHKTVSRILNAFCHPDVVKLVAEHLRDTT